MNKELINFLTENEGKTFYTVRNMPFTFETRNNGIYINRVRDDNKCTFTYNNIQKAYEEMPIKKPSDFSDGVWGKSYCFAILKVYMRV